MEKGARKRVRLPGRARSFARALFWVSLMRLGLAVLPFPSLLAFQRRFAAPIDLEPDDVQAHLRRASRAVDRASRWIPGARCLPQALAAQVLLARTGLSTDLRIGVAREPEEKLGAHAWVEHQGRVVVGERGIGRYTTLS